MQTLSRLISFQNPWIELIAYSSVVFVFATLGYLAREFAVDLQANFFSNGGGLFGNS
ncbi:hypothetical protein K9L27_04710 [Candidatus Gracilibacteria bacterium]|nr:hypothetical protein [Candidatus Gracilibacteria bacterium]